MGPCFETVYSEYPDYGLILWAPGFGRSRLKGSCVLQEPEQLPIFWFRIPNIVTVIESNTLNAPQNDIGTYSDPLQ